MKGRVKEQKGVEYYMQLPYSILLHEVEDDGGRYWIAEVPGLPGCKSHGSTVEEAVRSVEEAKKDWILDSLEKGEKPPIPIERERYSGKTLLRMSRSLHRALSLMAEAEKLSLNQLIVTILAKEVGGSNVLNRAEQKIGDLLDRISDVLEKERPQSSKLFRRLVQPYEAQQYFVVGTDPNIEAQVLVDATALLREAGSTDSPLEEYYGPILQSPGWMRTNFGIARVKGSESPDTVESKQK